MRQDVVWVVETTNAHAMMAMKATVLTLDALGMKAPVVFRRTWDGLDDERLSLHAATDLGGPMLDGLGDGLWLYAPGTALMKRNSMSFGILQAARTRTSKTEYISCPSCGRTLFDLQETTAKTCECSENEIYHHEAKVIEQRMNPSRCTATRAQHRNRHRIQRIHAGEQARHQATCKQPQIGQ